MQEQGLVSKHKIQVWRATRFVTQEQQGFGISRFKIHENFKYTNRFPFGKHIVSKTTQAFWISNNRNRKQILGFQATKLWHLTSSFIRNKKLKILKCIYPQWTYKLPINCTKTSLIVGNWEKNALKPNHAPPVACLFSSLIHPFKNSIYACSSIERNHKITLTIASNYWSCKTLKEYVLT